MPGFPELNQDDQLILIKCGFFEVWLTRMARMFNKAEGCLTFEDGSIIQKEELGVVFSVGSAQSQIKNSISRGMAIRCDAVIEYTY